MPDESSSSRSPRPGVDLPEESAKGLFSEADPDGLKMLYSAVSAAEADLLRQILAEAEFHPQFVPSTGTALGITGNPCIYVPTGEYSEASAFLNDYFNVPPEPEQPGA